MPASAPRARRLIATAVLAVLYIGAAGALGAVSAARAEEPSQAVDAVHLYDIPPGPLEEALIRFGRVSGHLVAADQALTEGARSPGLRGRYAVEAGLAALLAGSGLEATRMPDGGWRLRRVNRRAVQLGNLPEIEVIADALPSEQVYRTPAGVAVVTREQIERLPPRNASDLLHETTGVFTSSGRGDPGLSINIRGMQDFGRVNVMIDGARQNYQASGHGSNGQVYLDPALVGGVEIAKGPVSTVGGAGMIAGLVNFRTLDVGDILEDGQQRGGRINLTTGDNAYHFVGSAAAAARLGEEADLLVALSRKNVGEFRVGTKGDQYNGGEGSGQVSRTTSQDHWSGLVKMGWRPSAEHRFKLSYLGMDAKFSEAPAGETAYGERTQDYKVVTGTLRGDYSWRPASTWFAVDAGLYYTSTKRNQERAFAEGGPGAFRIRYQTETVGGSVVNESLLALGPFEASWKNGAEFWHDWTSPGFNTAANGSTEAEWYVGPTPEGKRTVASGFSEMTLDYQGWLQMIGGLRYDWYELNGNGQMFIGSVGNPPGVRPPTTNIYTGFEVDRHAASFAPKLTLAVKPVPSVQLYGSYGEGLRPPAITESLMYGMHPNNMFPFYPSPNLKEERSRTWEVGANLVFDNLIARRDRLRAKVAWFSTRVDNYIMSMPIMTPLATNGCQGLFCPSAYVNLQQPAEFSGVELQLEYDAGFVFGGLTATSVRSDLKDMLYNPFPLGSWVGYPETGMGAGSQDTVSSFLIGGPPRLKVAVTAGVRLLEGALEIGGRLRMEQPSKQGFMSQYKHTRAVDVWSTYRASRALTLRLAVENLFDRQYIEVSSGAGGFSWAPGRTVMASLTYNF